MRQIAGIGVLLAVAIAAARLTGGGGQSEEPASTVMRATQKPLHHKPKIASEGSPYRGGCTVFDADDSNAEADPKNGYPRDANRGAARAVIDSFFDLQAPTDLRKLTGVRYAIALVPDPRHTNLSLVFDREMVAVQQAAQDDGYSYNTSWFPWSPEGMTYSNVTDQQRYEDQTDQREACPGVLLFRKGIHDVRPATDPRGQRPANPPDPYAQALVVLVVGEQPTGGLNEDQWSNAIAWLHNNASPEEATAEPPPNRAGSLPSASPRTLSILGPYSSGTLVSLERALAALEPGPSPATFFPSASTPIHILSGSVRGCTSTRWFQQRIAETRTSGTTSFGSFQENDELQIYRLLNYMKHQGHDTSDIAILSEDETAYASAPVPSSDPQSGSSPCYFPYARGNRPVRFYYPRDISALRTAYEKQSVFGTSSGTRTTHPILQENAAVEGEPSTASDTIPAFGGAASPVAQEAVLYGIVSHLRAHHSRYILLRCTNPLDFLFLTRFFHRAFPEGRVITVGSDLLFRREIDTTEFRGVLSLSSYPLLPRNQHWSALTQRPETAPPVPHTHRVPESHGEGSYLAARYLFDSAMTWSAPVDRQQPLTLPFKEGIPDFADPFWMHTPTEPLTEIQAPTWLSVVGRDGYWPLAVLSDRSTPQACLDIEPPADSPRKKVQCPPRDASNRPAPPPSTMVRVAGGNAHYDLTQDGTHFHPTLLLSAPLPWWALLFGAVLLLIYQTAVVSRGSKHTSMGLCAPFRRLPTWSQGILLGINCAIVLLIFFDLFTIRCFPSSLDLLTSSSNMNLPKMIPVVAITIPLIVFVWMRFTPITAWTFALVYSFMAVATDLTIKHTVTTTDANSANGVPLFYRLAHVTGGVSPLVPVLFLLTGFYIWTWQALAGNALLCVGRPLLPRLKPRVPKPDDPDPTSFVKHWRTFWDTLVGILPDRPPHPDTHLLDRAYYRISHENAWNIVRVASPLSFPFTVVVLPANMLLAAILFLGFNGPPLLSLESAAYGWAINLVLLLCFLLTIAEAARLYLTWVELRHLLTALNRMRLRRTFAKLRAVDSNSLWSVSGNVQRVQLLFFSQQLDAANRLSRMTLGEHASLKRAVECGNRFAENCARKTRTGPLWEKSVLPKGEEPQVYIREVFNEAVADVLNELIVYWATEKDSLSLENSSSRDEDNERNVFAMELSDDPTVRTAEEFVCFHYIAFIQNILARMRTMTLSMVSLFLSVCVAISFYPFVPRTGISMWMLVNLLLIAGAVVYVYAGMERDETLSYITNTRPGHLSTEFYLKTAGFLAGPIIGLLTTQFPAISETVLSLLQPGLDALK